MAKIEAKALEKGIVRYMVSVVGISPMLQNPMTDDTLETLIRGSKGRAKPKNPDVKIEDIAKDKLCLSESGKFGIPSNYLFACLVDAGRQVIFEKKSKISTRDSSLLPAFLTINASEQDNAGNGFIPFKDQNVQWIADKRRGVLKSGPGGGVAVGIVRPKFMQWAFDVEIEVDLDQINLDKVRDLFVAAGRYSGLGDFRPSRKGPFGRFVTGKFVELGAVQFPMADAA